MRADALGLFWEDKPKEKKPSKTKTKRVKPPAHWEKDIYLPYLKEALEFNVPLYTDQQLMDAVGKEPLVCDIECYPNYFLVSFKGVDSGLVTYVEMYNGKELDLPKMLWIFANFHILTFNGIGYDVPMASIAATGKTTAELKQFSDMIIQTELRSYMILKQARATEIECNHIDIMEVAPLSASLKIYSGRIHSRRMQDLPFNPHKHLNPNQIAIVRLYCVNDLDNTIDLFNKLEPDVKLRVELGNDYNVDVRSKSDAQAAETIIKSELALLTGRTPYRPNIPEGASFHYKIPRFLRYESDLMNWVLEKVRNTPFRIGESGAVTMPPELAGLQITINKSTYTMGIGGLHSTEKSISHVADANYTLEEQDVASYYPRIIINQRLYPKHLGPSFLKVYIKIVERRLASKVQSSNTNLTEEERKAHKRTSNSLKIVINGSFGKLGSKWSILYSPDLLIQVTLTGQLSLLMLIERLELAGIEVVSANTDGVVIKCHVNKHAERDRIVAQWQRDTQFELEQTMYKALYSKDVNNYIAVKPSNSAKTKGAYAATGLSKNPTNFACVLAVRAYLTEDIPIRESILQNTNVTDFLTVRAVKGGAVFCRRIDWDESRGYQVNKAIMQANNWEAINGGLWIRKEWKKDKDGNAVPNYQALAISMDAAFETGMYEYGDFLGKAIRWYYSSEERGRSELVYAKSGNKVPKSEGAKPLMDLSGQIPADIDYEWYIQEAQSILVDIGAVTGIADHTTSVSEAPVVEVQSDTSVQPQLV